MWLGGSTLQTSIYQVTWYVTVDETWVHHYATGSKQRSKQWTKCGESAPKKPRTALSTGKVTATVFLDSQGIIFIDYLQKGQTTTGEYYVTLLTRLNEELRMKGTRLAREEFINLPRQRTSSHHCRRSDKIAWITVRIATPSSLFSWFGPL